MWGVWEQRERIVFANELHIKFVKIMEEKIIEILQDCKNGISVEICKDALLNLCVVSQQRELLIKELKDVDLKYIEDHEDQDWLVDRLIELINCG